MNSTRVAIISDTHGLLRPEVSADLQGVDHILHIGDVGSEVVLKELKTRAPLTVVRGNVDKGPWAEPIPYTAIWQVGDLNFYLIHILADLDLDPGTAGIHAVLYGHSHQPEEKYMQNTLYLNPGSCGPKRFNLPVSWVLMNVSNNKIELTWRTLP